jgi:hypothetical protein
MKLAAEAALHRLIDDLDAGTAGPRRMGNRIMSRASPRGCNRGAVACGFNIIHRAAFVQMRCAALACGIFPRDQIASFGRKPLKPRRLGCRASSSHGRFRSRRMRTRRSAHEASEGGGMPLHRV